MKAFLHTHGRVLLVLAALAVIPYLPLFSHPFIQDDYPNIEQARLYGPVSEWPTMVFDPVNRYRATSWVLTYWIDHLFGPIPPAFYAVSIGLHVLNTWLVYALGSWKAVGRSISAVAAGFFAVSEAHQEAIMWYSASNELLLFFFAALTFLCWISFVQNSTKFYWYLASLSCFILALLSKESAVVLVPLLLLPILSSPIGYRRLLLVPYGALAFAMVWLIFASRASSFRFIDGSFSLHAPFWITLPMSLARLLWPWGLLALVALLLCRVKGYERLLLLSSLWMGLALVPYSFLTYMPHVPSRQTYLASVGLAWIVGAGFCCFRSRTDRSQRTAVLAVALIAISSNVVYLWTRKRNQFLDRAAPTEALVALAQKVTERIYVRCYPDARMVADAAIRLRTGKSASILLWPGEMAANMQPAADFCWENPGQESSESK